MKNAWIAWLYGALCCLGFGTNSMAAATENTRIIECTNCTTPYEFKQAAIADNHNVQANATYTVVGSPGNGSVYAKVTGGWVPTYGMIPGYGDYIWYPSATLVNENGTPISSNSATAAAQMSTIDIGIFGFTRTAAPSSSYVTAVNVDDVYSSSFINSDDGEVSPGINQALLALNVNPGNLQHGHALTVIFSDGTKAVFIKNCQCTAMWIWNGQHAWDEDGRPINRNGTLKNNPNTGGTSSGSAAFATTAMQPYTGLDVGWFFFFWGQGQCVTTTSVAIDGVEQFTFQSYAPCG